MKINPVNPIIRSDTGKPYPGEKNNGAKKAAAGVKDAYIPARRQVKKAAYTKPLPGVDPKKIEKLKEESQRAYSHLRQLVEQLLKEQGTKYKRALGTDDAMVPVTREMRTEARALIAEGGELSAEKVSDRIVEFAKALSGGDKGKMGVLRGAIEKGFREAEKILGGLPDVSMRTYDLVMQKLDAWENE